MIKLVDKLVQCPRCRIIRLERVSLKLRSMTFGYPPLSCLDCLIHTASERQAALDGASIGRQPR